MRIFRLFSIIILCVATSSVDAKTSVEVVGNSDDNLGLRLIFLVKERVRSTTSLELTFDEEKPRLRVSVVVIDPTKSLEARSSGRVLYSVVIVNASDGVKYSYHLDNYINSIGRDRLDDAAEEIVARISEYSDVLANLPITRHVYPYR